jgi:syntaxin 1B/2/3
MSNMNGNDPNRLLNETRNIDRAIDDLSRQLERLKQLHTVFQNETQSDKNLPPQIDSVSGEIMLTYRELVNRVRKLKSDPESGNPRNAPQVGKIDRRLKTMITEFQREDSDHRKKLNERSAREYRIVRPDASEAEVREALEAGDQQIFSQAVRYSYQKCSRSTNKCHS